MTRILIALSAFLALGMSMSAQSLRLNENNIDEIVKAMTLEEKAQLLVGRGRSVAFLAAFGGNGMLGQHADIVSGAAGSTFELKRLGITPTVVADGLLQPQESVFLEGCERPRPEHADVDHSIP